MNQTEQMRKHILDLLNAVWKACGDDEKVVKATIKSQGGDYKAIKQTLAAKPAKLVRLTDIELVDIATANFPDGAMPAGFPQAAHAIMDAMEEKNK